MKGFPGHGAPVNLLSRNVLPPNELLLRGFEPTAASPVPTIKAPYGAISNRQPPCRPEVAGSPVSRLLARVAVVSSWSRVHATTRTSWVVEVRPPWQV